MPNENNMQVIIENLIIIGIPANITATVANTWLPKRHAACTLEKEISIQNGWACFFAFFNLLSCR
jgi:hypothetical protein